MTGRAGGEPFGTGSVPAAEIGLTAMADVFPEADAFRSFLGGSLLAQSRMLMEFKSVSGEML